MAKSSRLYFIDAIRAWAIIMMLQGHFIDGLLDPIYRNSDSFIFQLWLYFRGITAPVFFTVSGFIFTYLLIHRKETGLDNPRVKKGIRRGLQLVGIGYLLRLNVLGLFTGELYDAFYMIDVLHCIGLSLLALTGIYVYASKRKSYVFPAILVGITVALFALEPLYKDASFSLLPVGLANYFTKANGSVFTIIPWLGYATFGSFLSYIFFRFKNATNFYPKTIALLMVCGSILLFASSKIFLQIYALSGIELFRLIEANNYLFIRLGDVLLIFSIFMLFRRFMNSKNILKIGASTLSIYVIHFILLYGSFTGFGLYRFVHHSLAPLVVITGALAFVFCCCSLSIAYGKQEHHIKHSTDVLKQQAAALLSEIGYYVPKYTRLVLNRLRTLFYAIFGIVKD